MTSAAASTATILSPEYGNLFLTTIPVAGFINEIAAVLLSKKVYEKTGEAGKQEEDDAYIDENSNYRKHRRCEKYYNS